MTSVIAEMEAWIPSLRRYASALLRDHQEVDDLVHDCLVLALDRLHTLREDGQLRAWLFTILHNLFVSQVRRAKVRGTAVPIDAADEVVFDRRPRQDDYMHAHDLMRALHRLPEEQRSVLLLLVAVEDLSYAEVARVMRVPIGTVMSRLSRAREKLRREECMTQPLALRRVK
jgi:RNA polymerase sigma factor (sigma-70 family)